MKYQGFGMHRPQMPGMYSPTVSIHWFVLVFLGLIFCLVCAVTLGGFAFYLKMERSLPSTQALKNYRPPIVTSIYGGDGSLMAELYVERRYLTPLEKMPPHLIQAFLAAEDARFYEHPGVDVIGIIRALVKNLRAGEVVQGGSTITQQVIKSLILTPERTYVRKMKEAILAYRIDHSLSKDDILYLYLNQVYLGAGAYGIEAGAQAYFGKHVEELTLSEAAMLAGLPKAPSRYSPLAHYEVARARQKYALQRMADEGFIRKKDVKHYFDEPIQLAEPKPWKLNSFLEEVRRQVEARYGRDVLYKEGLKIYTTIDPAAQRIAEQAVEKGLRELDKRHGYRGPQGRVAGEQWPQFLKELGDKNQNLAKGQIVEALVTEYDAKTNGFFLDLGTAQGRLDQAGWKWTRISARRIKNVIQLGSIIWVKLEEQTPEATWTTSLEQEPEAQGAFMAMKTASGAVLAMVGGRDFEQTQFNRATQAIRQPGSSFKPIVYAAALDRGYSPASILIDSPIVRKDNEGYWKPSNYDHRFLGPILFRNALIHSRNVVTVKLLESIGVDYVIDYAHRLGIRSPLTRTLALALGASGLTLWELVTAYSVFSNLGERVEPYMVDKILDRNGDLVEQHEIVKERVISPQTAFIMTDILQGVIQRGTGVRARVLERPAAGKTGTTNDLRDAWFIGYTPSLLAGAWVGNDDDSISLGPKEAGSRAALPIWLKFMQQYLQDKPVETFAVPERIIFTRMDSEGEDGVPGQNGYGAFLEGQTPTQESVGGTGSQPTHSSESFFKSDLF